MNHDPNRPSKFVETVREQTRKYLEDLKLENEMLSQKVEVLECDKHILESKVEGLRSELDREGREREKLFERIETMERLRASSAAEYAMVEEQNNNLASLYSATYSLHGTMDRDEILGVIKEIVINLIGSEEMAIFECDESGALRLLDSVGLAAGFLEEIPPDTGIIGHVVRTRRQYLPDHGDEGIAPAPHESQLTACVPLAMGDRVTGAIAVFRLLGQKRGLVPIDYELLDLLGSQAAIALHAAKLHARYARAADE